MVLKDDGDLVVERTDNFVELEDATGVGFEAEIGMSGGTKKKQIVERGLLVGSHERELR